MPKIKKSTVVVEYLKPVNPAEMDKEERKHVGTYVADQIKEAYFINKEKYFAVTQDIV